jgi:hypothetical protein
MIRSLLTPRAGTRRFGVALTLTIAALTAAIAADARPDPDAVAAMERFLARPIVAHQYSASRRLEASGVGQRAWLDVRTSFTLSSGLIYDVTAEGGSGFIRARVLRSLLDEERRVTERGGVARVALSTDNYRFQPVGLNSEGLAVVNLTPRRKDRSLLIGQMFLNRLDGELVRVEGRLAKNPSFWVTRVNVVRWYGRIDGVIMPVSLETTAQLRLFGSSALRMTYRYSNIDERPVENSPTD